MRVAVVASLHDSDWSEENLIIRRLAGAIACNADVELLVAGGSTSGPEREGAIDVRRFAAAVVSAEQRAAYLRAAFGFHGTRVPRLCGCLAPLGREIARALSPALQERLAALAAPPSADLQDHLASGRYDVVVVAGYANAIRVGERHGTRRVLAPLARDEPSFHLPIYDAALASADAILVFGDTEEALVRRRLGPGGGPPIANVAFAVRVDAEAEISRDDGKPVFVIARDWRERFPIAWLESLGKRLARSAAKAELRLVGPGAGDLPQLEGVVASVVRSRRDVEGAMARATAVLDPEPHRLLGREVLEAMMLGAPVIVPAYGGATRDHAESGDGGLWYRSEAELDRCLELVADRRLRATLGAQGRRYAERRYGDPDAFVRAVADAVVRP